MSVQKITKMVAREGIVGLQKLEAEGSIQGDFNERIGNVYKRGRDGKVALAIAKGIGRHSDASKVYEMLQWLEDDDYLIDYGYIIVSLLKSITYENPSSLEESKYMKVINELFLMGFLSDNDKFDINFLSDYKKKFRPDVIEWLETLQKKMILSEGSLIVKTKLGYSYIDEEDYPYELVENTTPYMKTCRESGMHYNRYWGISCVD